MLRFGIILMSLLFAFGCVSNNNKLEVRVYVPEDYFWTGFDSFTNDTSFTYCKDYKYDDVAEAKKSFDFMEELYETNFSDNACIIYNRENNLIIIRGQADEADKLETIFEAGKDMAYKKRLRYVE